MSTFSSSVRVGLIEISTEVLEASIVQTIRVGEVQQAMVMKTTDEQIRAALISLGWTPPKS